MQDMRTIDGLASDLEAATQSNVDFLEKLRTAEIRLDMTSNRMHQVTSELESARRARTDLQE
eukprot:1125960-Amphidinium_carterae.1